MGRDVEQGIQIVYATDIRNEMQSVAQNPRLEMKVTIRASESQCEQFISLFIIFYEVNTVSEVRLVPVLLCADDPQLRLKVDLAFPSFSHFPGS